MKLFALVCLAVVASASPQFRQQPLQQQGRPIAILRENKIDDGDGNFNYEFETENGIYTSVVGRPGSRGQSNMQGTYRFVLPDGAVAEVRFIADENGYQADSPLIPVAPAPLPLPAHALEQIRFTEELRRQGARWNEQGFRISR